MRMFGLLVAAFLLVSWPAAAEPLKAAVFDFELLDTSLEGEMKGPQADEQRRLRDISEQLRKGLADAGKFVVLDIAPVNAAAHASNLQACGGCDVEFAQRLGADLAITGQVRKGLRPHPQHEYLPAGCAYGRLVSAMSADFRSNTDEIPGLAP